MQSAFRLIGALALVALSVCPTTGGADPRLVDPAVEVVFGPVSWDGASRSLQSIVDARYGPGRINVETDYIGAKPGDIDPWFWIDKEFRTFLVKEVAGNAPRNVLGWYRETESWTPPVIDGVDDGLVFSGSQGAGAIAFVVLPRPTKFGFYMIPNGGSGVPHVSPGEKFYSNRLFNDRGPDGGGALHEPFDGDVQALVFDISEWTQPNTWLVCFEDLDSGQDPSPCCNTTDNDFNDMVFEVQAFGATPVVASSFGALKVRYR